MTSLKLIAGQFEMQTRLFKNALEGLEADYPTRPSEATNHIAWLAGHLASARYSIISLLGASAQEPHPDVYGQGKGIDENLTYPSLDRCLADWNEVTPLLMDVLKNVNEEALSSKSPFPTPMGEKLGDVIAFFAHHEAYHIGQIAILRKYFGHEAMKYN